MRKRTSRVGDLFQNRCQIKIMSTLSRSNLQEFCRICLCNLHSQQRREETPSLSSYNIYLLHNLSELVIALVSLDMKDEKQEYPKCLCSMCYEKLIDFEKFRNLTQKSTKVLEAIVNDGDGDGSRNNNNNKAVSNTSASSIRENMMVRHNDEFREDYHLLLPGLKPTLDESRPLTPVPMKFQYDEDDDMDSEENYVSFENNDIGNANDSIGDDAEADDDDVDYHPANRTSTTSQNLSNKSHNASCNSPNYKRYTKVSLQCPRCDKKFYKQHTLDAHIRGDHEGHEKPFLCLECPEKFTRLQQLNEHIRLHPMLQQNNLCGLDGCEASFKTKTTLKTHRKNMHPERGDDSPYPIGLRHDHKEHICKVCGVSRFTSTEMQAHMRSHNSNLDTFKCNLCPLQFHDINAINRHVRLVHEEPQQYPFSICPKRFSTSSSLVSHERLHAEERPASCDIYSNDFHKVEGIYEEP